jgi:signal transduction histidine kinase
MDFGFRKVKLRTKLLLTMLSLLVLSITSLFFLHMASEQRLISQIREYTEDISTALEVVQEQPVGEGDQQVVLKAYMDKLGQLGVKGVDFADPDSAEVQASSNPRNVGKPLVKGSKRKGPKEYVIKGVLGEETGPPGRQITTTLTFPIVLGDRRVGYLLITRYLDDFSALSREALLSRVLVTLAVFALGMLVSLYLSWSFSRPVQELTKAARQVAAGDLSVHVPSHGSDEIGSLARTFNEMVEGLRESRQLEERLHFAERSTAMGRLASALAHEIRNPLNFINLSIDHVRERLAPDESRRREDFERILSNVKAEISRLNRLVRDFLSFGKPMRLDQRPCAMDDLVREVAAVVDHKAKDQGIALAIEVEEAMPTLVADPELLKTCLLNLMINAIDAMPTGGVLTVGLRRDQDEVVTTVADTGQGMSAQEIHEAFEPYFSTKETGVGLGLALTRKIVEDHGGRVELESEPGRGTRARIRLPLEGRAQPPAEAEAVQAARA